MFSGILKDCGSSKTEGEPMEFHQLVLHWQQYSIRHSMTGSKKTQKKVVPVEVEGIPGRITVRTGNEERTQCMDLQRAVQALQLP